MRSFHFSVQSRGRGSDVAVINAQVLQMPMKFGLEFVTVVCADGVQAKRELLDHVVDEPDGVFLCMSGINFQGPDAGCIVNRCVLVTLQLKAAFINKSQKLNINLNVMTRDLFLIPFIAGNIPTETLRKIFQPSISMVFNFRKSQ